MNTEGFLSISEISLYFMYLECTQSTSCFWELNISCVKLNAPKWLIFQNLATSRVWAQLHWNLSITCSIWEQDFKGIFTVIYRFSRNIDKVFWGQKIIMEVFSYVLNLQSLFIYRMVWNFHCIPSYCYVNVQRHRDKRNYIDSFLFKDLRLLNISHFACYSFPILVWCKQCLAEMQLC